MGRERHRERTRYGAGAGSGEGGIEQLCIDDLLLEIDQIPDERLDDLAESVAVLDQIADTLEQRRLNRTRPAKAALEAD